MTIFLFGHLFLINFPFLATNRTKRSSPVIHHQRPSGSNMMYNDMNDEMMFSGGPSSSSERNLTPLSRHRADEGL